jgi:tetrahydromethanopterin S-methyltransferase subunit G
MNDTTTPTVEAGHTTDQVFEAATEADTGSASQTAAEIKERYSEILGQINQTLGQVDWNQMGRIGKAVGILVVVIVVQILIKGVLDTINLLPIIPGLLELLGLVVVGQWSWKNLTTSEKRSAVVARLENLRNEYLG